MTVRGTRDRKMEFGTYFVGDSLDGSEAHELFEEVEDERESWPTGPLG
jgi:hypothetical protein